MSKEKIDTIANDPRLSRFSEDEALRIAGRLLQVLQGSDLESDTLLNRVLDTIASPVYKGNILEKEHLLALAGLRVSDLEPRIQVHDKNTSIGIFGWGVVAPSTPNIHEFRRKIREGKSWLTPMEDFGPNNFMVGKPDFDFNDYRQWIIKRMGPGGFARINTKMGLNVKYSLGAYIQALSMNPGLEELLRKIGNDVHVYISTALGEVVMDHKISLEYYRAQKVWDRFWAQPENCSLRMEYESMTDKAEKAAMLNELGAPADPRGIEPEDPQFDKMNDEWNRFWAGKSEKLTEYLEKSRKIHYRPIGEDVDRQKASVIKKRLLELMRLQREYGSPPEPWNSVSQNRLWNIDNSPGAQITMVSGIHGPHISPVNACTAFIVTLYMGMEAIRSNRAKVVVIGATESAPHPINVGTFYDAKVLTNDGRVSLPVTELRGTHVSGGAAVWIIGDLDFMVSRGFKPLGAEPVTVELNSDADHIITPSEVYPRHCIRNALKKAGIKPDDIETFDLHATATPGDWAEINSVHEVLGDKPYFTARKGIFGHGMAVSGGWELTAQYMGMEEGVIFRTNDKKVQLHRAIEKKHPRIVTNEEIPYKGGYVGKISMGVGGINGVVISKPLSFDLLPFQFATLAGISINKLKKLIDEGTIEKKIDEFGLTRIPFRELKKLNGNKS